MWLNMYICGNACDHIWFYLGLDFKNFFNIAKYIFIPKNILFDITLDVAYVTRYAIY